MKHSPSSGMARTPAQRRAVLIMTLLAAALVGLFLFSFVIGRYDVPVGEVVRILLGQIFPIEETWAPNMARAVLNIRLPRIALACLVGCCLSLAGTAYQSVFQNPMAAPDILGASSGACFGAALAILLGLASGGITAMAFVFSMVTVGLVYLISIRVASRSAVIWRRQTERSRPPTAQAARRSTERKASAHRSNGSYSRTHLPKSRKFPDTAPGNYSQIRRNSGKNQVKNAVTATRNSG